MVNSQTYISGFLQNKNKNNRSKTSIRCLIIWHYLLNENNSSKWWIINAIILNHRLYHVLHIVRSHIKKYVHESIREETNVHERFNLIRNSYHTFNKKHWYIWKTIITSIIIRLFSLSSQTMQKLIIQLYLPTIKGSKIENNLTKVLILRICYWHIETKSKQVQWLEKNTFIIVFCLSI